MRLFPKQKKKKTSHPSLSELFPDFSSSTIEIIKQVQPYTMTSPERIAALCDAVRYLVGQEVPGALVECGVWRGGSSLAAILALLETGQVEREIWLYDTFEGMTAPSELDVDFLGNPAHSLLANADRDDSRSVWCCSQLEQVRQLLIGSGYPEQSLRFIVGPVESTIPSEVPDQIALLRLDTDWYESTRHELVHLLPRLQPGGVLIVDDYGHWEGCRRAVDEYFSDLRVPMFLQRIDYTGRIGVLQRSFRSERAFNGYGLERKHVNA